MIWIRKRLPLLTLLAVLVTATAGFYVSHRAVPRNTVTLPIRVYPTDGTSEHVEEVGLHVSDPTGVNRLYVQAHQPFYHRGGIEQSVAEGFDPEAAAAIRINGGDWIDVRDENVTCAQPEENYGCVAGIYSTIRFSVPVANAQKGTNIVEFKFNGTDGIRSGYRVLKLGFMRAGNDLQTFDPLKEGAHDGTELRYEDFSTWKAPEGVDGSDDVQAGRELFKAENSLINDGKNQEAIHAACSSCHARDGRDLKYFNYSNRSIVARSRFHGLSNKEGRQIAAYIRSLKLKKESGEVYEAPGTPWDPPYQPGPSGFGPNGQLGPDEANQVYWAAGAGLDAVLESDKEMLPYLFPDGNGGVDRFPNGDLNWHHLSVDSTFNMRATPVALQFPDWNNWLPDIHPLDAIGSYSSWQSAENSYENQLIPATTADEVRGAIQAISIGMATKFSKPAGMTDNEFALARLSLEQWRAVKAWEGFKGKKLEDRADDLYCGHSIKPFCEPLGWAGRDRVVFDLGPHINSPTGTYSEPFAYGSGIMDGMMSHVWYQLQTVINAGAHPEAISQKPVDWNYQWAFIKTPAGFGVGAGWRALASHAKKYQLQSNGYGIASETCNGLEYSRGWEPFTTNWHRFADRARKQYTGDETNIFKDLTQREMEDAVTALLRVWWDYTKQFPTDDYCRGGTENDRWYTDASDTQAFGYTSPNYSSQQMYQGLYFLNEEMPGVRRGVMDSIATWGAQMWPNTSDPSWDELVDYKPSDGGKKANKPPVVRITNLASGNTFTAPAQLVVEVDAHDPDGSIRKVAFFADGTKRGEKTKAPYRFQWKDVPAGPHMLKAVATDTQGAHSTSAQVSITVNEDKAEEPRSTTQRVFLQQGWNLVSSSVRPDQPALEKVFADVLPHLVLVKDEAGRTFIPNYDVNAIGDWATQEAYMVYVQKDDTLQIKGTPVDAAKTAISLKSGWNMMPYLGNASVPIEEALGPVADDVVLVKDYAGRTYIPDYELNDIGRLKPGQGYKVYVSRDVDLAYAATSGPRAAKKQGVQADTTVPGLSASTVLVVESPGLQEGTRIMARSAERGRLGEGIVRDGVAALTIRGDESATPDRIEGAQPGEKITLEAYTGQGRAQQLSIASLKDALSGPLAKKQLRYREEGFYVAQAETRPSEFALEQNYPNPFNPSTKIVYHLPEKAKVQLEVFNMLGQRVRVLVNGKAQRAGRHAVSFEADDVALASGVYFYRLEAGSFSKMKRMMLAK